MGEGMCDEVTGNGMGSTSFFQTETRHQLRRLNPQGDGQLLDCLNSGRAFPVFDERDMSHMQARACGELFLRQALGLASRADKSTEKIFELRRHEYKRASAVLPLP